ncbi:MAG: flagellin [Acidobacteriia bacterium]|nr:flagellin [Terriglobia bacterium]
MAISILNNIASLTAQNQLAVTQTNLNKTLFQLSSGSRINSGADDAAGLAIADGLHANITALTQSAQNANGGVGSLQVADGSLAQVTQLLNRAVTLATESANGTVSDSQRTSIQAEYGQIINEINSIGSSTNYNGSAVFSGATSNIFLSDGVSNTTISVGVGNLTTASLGLAAGTINLATPATAATAQITLTGQPVAADQVSVDGQTYTFQSTGNVAAAGDVQIGSTLAQTVLNLAHAINNSGGTSGAGNDYIAAGNAANTHASATVNGSTITLTSLTTGTGGNAFTLTSPTDTSGHISLSGGTFTGGAAATTTPTAEPNDLTTAANAQLTLGLINTAIASVASTRGQIGANINRLQAASNVITNQTQNLTAAEDGIRAADIPSVVANLSRFTILNQSGISALAQANSAQQSILTLLR